MADELDKTFDFHCSCTHIDCCKDVTGEPLVILEVRLKDQTLVYLKGVYNPLGCIVVTLKNVDGSEENVLFVTRESHGRDPVWFREVALRKKCYLAENAWTCVSRIPLSNISNNFVFTDPDHLVCVISHYNDNLDHNDDVVEITHQIVNKCVTLKDYYIGLQAC